MIKPILTEKQRFEAISFIAGWLEKISVGCLIVGLFQREHILGGLLGAGFFFLAGFILKIRGAK